MRRAAAPRAWACASPATRRPGLIRVRIEEDPRHGGVVQQADADALTFPLPMFVDSHCHLSFPELKARLPDILADMRTCAGRSGHLHLHADGGVRGRACAGASSNHATVGDGGRAPRHRGHARARCGRAGAPGGPAARRRHRRDGAGLLPAQWPQHRPTWSGSASASARISAPRSRPPSPWSSTPESSSQPTRLRRAGRGGR